ncbi:hypothetical protein M9H77_31400 [Catharanthus roseus]|uniref:Uncharacterized protein n=1 Tax=Catharanthus roseus TaxID=4058 RepID=A0ACC0A2C2_CATRO|nr:hypothetical protein M9H77_31400 [Catharanthus roseus]
MARSPSFFLNLCFRRTPKTPFQNPIRNRSLSNSNDIKSGNEELRQNPDHEVSQSHQFVPQSFSEIAKDVSIIIRTRPRWEQTLLSEFPYVNFADPVFYREVFKQQKLNAFFSLRFYDWISSQSGFLPDQFSCSLVFNGLIEAKAGKAAKSFLEVTKFMPEPKFLEPYLECLCEAGLINEALDLFDHLKSVSYCSTLKTWNSAMSWSLRAGRADAVWKVYGDMMENGVVGDVDTMGYLIQAFCMDGNLLKGYELLRQVLEAGHVPSNVAFNKLIRGFTKKGNYFRMSDLLHTMIAKNCPPDTYTYQEVINGLCKRNMKHEGLRIFNDLKDRGYSPDRVMYTTTIHGLCKMKWLGDAQKLWTEMIHKGIIPNHYTYNSLIYGYLKVGNIIEAQRLYGEMYDRGYVEKTVSYNNMINGLSAHGKVEMAYDLFKEMVEKNVARDIVTYNSLIRGFCKEGKIAEATKILYELLKEGLQPSTATYTALIENLCEVGHVQEGILLWKDMQDRGVIPATGTHDAIIVGLVEEGSIAEGMEWLATMLKSGLRPRKETFEKLFQCLSGADKLDDALFIVNYMLKMGYALSECIYSSLVDKLCGDDRNNAETYVQGFIKSVVLYDLNLLENDLLGLLSWQGMALGFRQQWQAARRSLLVVSKSAILKSEKWFTCALEAKLTIRYSNLDCNTIVRLLSPKKYPSMLTSVIRSRSIYVNNKKREIQLIFYIYTLSPLT